MTTNTINDSPVWKQFETEAKKRRRNPVKLMLDLIKEQVEIWEHERLDDEISKDAQKSGYTETDAVELVKQHRLEKKQRAAS
ncbi:MAG: hypothetical protein IT173_07395 [Acidobacteria bacterium]|nr:hypothetical protein [Acidobacteriota bacterium]